MNSSIFIAKRLFTAKENNNNYTRPIIRIAILAIAISVAVMILSVFILSGFKDDISNKVIGFGSHIKITKFNNNQSFENDPIDFDVEIYNNIKNLDFVSHINKYATKAGIIKNDDEIHGVVLKGVSGDYNWDFFKNNLISGEIPNIKESIKDISNGILISESISKKLNIKLGEDLVIYFIQNPARVRKFIVSGIYKTALSEFDDITAFADLNHLIKLNNWNANQIGGYEIETKNFDNVGIYTSAGVVKDADVFATAVADGAAIAEVRYEAANLNTTGQQLYELAGDSSDPGGYYYIAATMSAAGGTAGDMAFIINYVVN